MAVRLKNGLPERAESLVPERIVCRPGARLLDRTGRLQLPKDYLEALSIKGGSRVKVDLDKEAERIYIQKAE